MATSRELRERAADAVRTSEGRCFWGDACVELREATRALLSALAAEDRERQQHAERIVGAGEIPPVQGKVEEVCDASGDIVVTLDLGERGKMVLEGDVRVSVSTGDGFPVGWDVLISRRYSGSWPSLAALQPCASGEHVECDDANEPRDGRQDGP